MTVTPEFVKKELEKLGKKEQQKIDAANPKPGSEIGDLMIERAQSAIN